jgi:glycosyltransferase involved in cell wall biosynthesis
LKNLISSEEKSFYLPIIEDKKTLLIVITKLTNNFISKHIKNWINIESKNGRNVKIALIYQNKKVSFKNKNIEVIERDKDLSVKDFLYELSNNFKKYNNTVSTHFLNDSQLMCFWNNKIKTIPVIYSLNKEINDIYEWKVENVPTIIVTSDFAKKELFNLIDEKIIIKNYELSVKPSNNFQSIDININYRTKLNIPENSNILGLIGLNSENDKNSFKKIDFLIKSNDIINQSKDTYILFFGINKISEIDSNFIRKIENTNSKFIVFNGNFNEYASIIDYYVQTNNFNPYSYTIEKLVKNNVFSFLDMSYKYPKNNEKSEMIDYIKYDFKNAGLFAKYILDNKSSRNRVLVNDLPRSERLLTLNNINVKINDDKINTLFITANLNLGGAQRSLCNLAKEFNEANNSFSIAVCSGSTNSYFSKYLTDLNINAFNVSKNNNIYDIAESILLFIKKHSVKKIVFWNVDPRIKLLISKFNSVDTSIIEVSPGANANERLLKTSDFQKSIGYTVDDFYESLSHIVLKHNRNKENISKQYFNKTVVINNGVFTNKNNNKNKGKENSFIVCGRISESKQVNKIIKCFKRLCDYTGDKELELDIFGQSEINEKDYLIKVLTDSQGYNVNLKGSSFDLSQFNYNYLSCIVLGINQGCPNTILEAMSHGIHVICNDSGGSNELINNKNDNGIILDKEDVDENDLFNAMFSVYQNKENTFIKGQKSINILKENKFCMNSMRDNYMRLLA